MTYTIQKAEEYPFLDDETIDELLDNANDEMFTFCEKLIREYCYFLTCCRDTEKVSYRGKTLSPSPLVDLVWHEHILATKEYMKFCDEVFGVYLHHTPGDYDIEFYENTIEAYDRCIWKPRSSDIWPEPDDLEELWFGSDQSGMDCG